VTLQFLKGLSRPIASNQVPGPKGPHAKLHYYRLTRCQLRTWSTRWKIPHKCEEYDSYRSSAAISAGLYQAMDSESNICIEQGLSGKTEFKIEPMQNSNFYMWAERKDCLTFVCGLCPIIMTNGIRSCAQILTAEYAKSLHNIYAYIQFFFKEIVRYLVWTCRVPISLILGTRFSILETQIGSLKRLKKNGI